MRDRPLRPPPVAASFKSGRSRHVNLYPRPSLVFGRVLRGTAMEICQEPAPAMRTPLSTLYMRPLPLTLHALDSEAGRRLFAEALADGGLSCEVQRRRRRARSAWSRARRRAFPRAGPRELKASRSSVAHRQLLEAVSGAKRRRPLLPDRRISRRVGPRLVLDTARFKYPPHWVPLEALFAAMLGPRRRDRPAPRLAQLARQAARATRPLCLRSAASTRPHGRGGRRIR